MLSSAENVLNEKCVEFCRECVNSVEKVSISVENVFYRELEEFCRECV